MKKNFIFFAVFSIASLNLFAQSAITKSDYEIYAEVLRNLRKYDIETSKKSFSFVIADVTYSDLSLCCEYNEKKYGGLNQDFERKNQNPSKLKKLFPVNYKYELADKYEIEKLLDDGETEIERLKDEEEKSQSLRRTSGWSEVYWKYFYEKYKNTGGYYRFSRVGYTANKRFAVITIEGKGESWSSNVEYLFEKIKNKWVIVQSSSGFGIA